MTRECSVDFLKMKDYIGNYGISANLLESRYLAHLKLMHKCYFANITWNAELLSRKTEYLNQYNNTSDEIIYRLSETVSDLGSSLFNWANGNYKVARVMLRVAIENFIRAISSLEDKDQAVEKNIYRLFSNASHQKIFNDKNHIKICFDSLHNDYKLLCQDTHTATVQNMEHLTSLADLPTFHKEKAANSAEVYIRISKNITSMFCMLFNGFFHKMHHRNKENVLHCLPLDIKPFLQNPNN